MDRPLRTGEGRWSLRPESYPWGMYPKRPRYKAKREEWTQIAIKKRTRCRICGKNYNLSLHHVVPKSLLGDDYADNIICLCGDGVRGCHGLIEAFHWPTRVALRQLMTQEEIDYVDYKMGRWWLDKNYPETLVVDSPTTS